MIVGSVFPGLVGANQIDLLSNAAYRCANFVPPHTPAPRDLEAHFCQLAGQAGENQTIAAGDTRWDLQLNSLVLDV